TKCSASRWPGKWISLPTEDVQRLFDALAFNYFIGGTDAHAKNYSLLIDSGGMARLAPLYDISSALAYPELDIRAIRMAMRIGSHYNWC
ncbi:HipA domain-containing protein, partial [Enterobacter hormaechei]|uniref:HipA domain-containing protein n=1 Tax=Enterobacter hormaechei TaxID=158836 RepID=UPI0013D248CF